MLNKIIISAHANRVWKLLHTGDKWNYNHLGKTLSLENHELNAALGWLAREDKIEFEEGRKVYMYLLKIFTLNFIFNIVCYTLCMF